MASLDPISVPVRFVRETCRHRPDPVDQATERLRALCDALAQLREERKMAYNAAAICAVEEATLAVLDEIATIAKDGPHATVVDQRLSPAPTPTTAGGDAIVTSAPEAIARAAEAAAASEIQGEHGPGV